MRIAILQSSYVPWKGYFDLIHSVDEFVLFDDVQLHAARLAEPQSHQDAERTSVADDSGATRRGVSSTRSRRLPSAIRRGAFDIGKPSTANYGRAPVFREYAERFERLYLDGRDTRLSAINFNWIKAICGILGICTKLSWSMDYELVDGRTERLVDICRQAGATTYVSGPSARSYIDHEQFLAANVDLAYFDYSGYPEYPQLFPPFDHHVSVLDLIFNQGPDATRYMLSF